MYILIRCPVCDESLGASHAYGIRSVVLRHVTEKHREVAIEAAEIEERIRSFRKRYGRNILFVN